MQTRAEIIGKGEPLHLVTSSVPVPPPGMVRIKTAYAGVCHSDLHIVNNDLGHFETYGEERLKGMVLGHEISGYIDDIGKGANLNEYNLEKGDPVVIYPWVGCSNCPVCKGGHSNMCSAPGGNSYNTGCGPNAEGGYQTHVMVRPHALLKVPSEIPMEIACMLPCSAGTAYSALSKIKDAIFFGNLRTGGKARLLIIGAGGLGLWAVQLAKAMYPGVHVIVADITESKFHLAKVYGADETVLWNVTAEPSQNAEAILKNGGADAVADFCGNGSTATAAMNCVTQSGTVVVVGLSGGNISVDLRGLIYASNNICGNSTLSIKQLSEVIDLVAQGKVKYAGCIYFPFEKVNEALNELKQGKINGRAIIDFSNNHCNKLEA